jgi:subtilisin-like proprotein convertase family protein
MTQDEITEMAKEAHRKLVTEVYVGHMGQLDPWTIELLKIFAKLVAAKEREACAKECEHTAQESDSFTESILRATATQIRARGEQA